MQPKLEKQIEREAAEIANAPRIEPLPNLAVRCHFCGQIARTLTLIEVIDKQERWRGECCGG